MAPRLRPTLRLGVHDLVRLLRRTLARDILGCHEVPRFDVPVECARGLVGHRADPSAERSCGCAAQSLGHSDVNPVIGCDRPWQGRFFRKCRCQSRAVEGADECGRVIGDLAAEKAALGKATVSGAQGVGTGAKFAE